MQFDTAECRGKARSFEMNGAHSRKNPSSSRASCDTVMAGVSRHDSFEEEILISEPTNRYRPPFWRRHLLPFCLHLSIFLAYSILALLAMDTQSKGGNKRANLLYCMFHQKPEGNVEGLTADFSQHLQMKPCDGSCITSTLAMAMKARTRDIRDPNSKKPGTVCLEVSRITKADVRAATDNILSEEMNIRFSLEDLKQFGRDEDAVQLPDGSGYVGTLNIYHEIHCVVCVTSPTASLDFG